MTIATAADGTHAVAPDNVKRADVARPTLSTPLFDISAFCFSPKPAVFGRSLDRMTLRTLRLFGGEKNAREPCGSGLNPKLRESWRRRIQYSPAIPTLHVYLQPFTAATVPYNWRKKRPRADENAGLCYTVQPKVLGSNLAQSRFTSILSRSLGMEEVNRLPFGTRKITINRVKSHRRTEVLPVANGWITTHCCVVDGYNPLISIYGCLQYFLYIYNLALILISPVEGTIHSKFYGKDCHNN
ncbi:hypothetical protein [Collimonas sp.]|uniref:hypothetical protein n=1 Tax=Collimonas sp. TaxID=1963772 RepID=UPI002BC3794B|nr:hypothetical protein [Collimonas sp.]HWX04157.1 hypothetical protein [Collimonas sp.]